MSECRQWPKVRLGDVLTVRHGKSQREVEVAYGPYPILATGGQIGWAQKPLYSEPSVLIGRKGTIDKPQYRAEPFWTVDTLFYTEISPAVDPRYLYFLFETIDWRSMNEASGVPSLSSSRIEGLEVYLPPLSEQVLIREYIDDVDDLIASLERLIAKKQAVKQGMMQQLLTGRTRLPGFSRSWRPAEIGSLVNQHRGTVDPGSQQWRVFQHFSLPAFDDNEKPVTESGDSIASTKFLVPPEAVLVSKLNPRIPRIWAPEYIEDNAVASTEFVVMTARECLSRSFFKWLMRSRKVTSRMKFLATGTTGSHSRISPRQIMALQVGVPDEEEQSAIAAVLDDVEAEIAVLREQLEKARDVKVGMMQQLLTGRVRLPVEVTV